MNDELFEELLESVREGGAILRGERQAARTTVVPSPATGGLPAYDPAAFADALAAVPDVTPVNGDELP